MRLAFHLKEYTKRGCVFHRFRRSEYFEGHGYVILFWKYLQTLSESLAFKGFVTMNP